MSKTDHIHRTAESRNDWETPPEFFDRLDAEFGFEIDACANALNNKVIDFFDIERDGLECDWRARTVWCNPPYSDTAAWLEKAHDEAHHGATVVMLIPARTDTRYWHDFVMKASEIRLVKGRLRFVGAPSSAPFPSAVVIFRPGWRYPVPMLTTMEAQTRPAQRSETDPKEPDHAAE